MKRSVETERPSSKWKVLVSPKYPVDGRFIAFMRVERREAEVIPFAPNWRKAS